MLSSQKMMSAPSGGSDDNFENVTLLLNGNGTNGAQNNTFVDSSTNAFSITRNGNTTQGSFSPYGSNWSNYFDGSSTLTVASNSALQFNGAFTIEAWVYLTTSSTERQIYSSYTGGGDNVQFYVSIGNKLVCTLNGGSFTITGSTTINANTWYHFAVARSGSTVTLYVNGVSDGSGTYSSTAPTTQSGATIGNYAGGGSYYLTGYISNLRVVKGTAVYTSTFTPPTTPLTAISGTSLLTCQSNRFIDNSSNAFSITANGTPSVQRFSPFNPTASYDTATIGGSGYFDGTGDYLTAGAASNWTFLNNGSDWTVEFFVYTGDVTTEASILSTAVASANIGLDIAIYNSNIVVTFYRGSSGSYAAFTSSGTVKTNQWNYVAITFTNSTKTCAFYINGASAGSSSNTGFSYSSSNPTYTLRIGHGAYSSAIYPLNGYLSNVRVSSNIRSSLTTVPTSPYSSDANTSLLCNMTNAGIPDSAMMNDLETVGNAQVSTSVKKFGTGSIAFDGTGDYLITNIANSDLYAFGTGDFTIEYWLYVNSVSGYQLIFDNRPVGLNSNYLSMTVGNNNGTIYYSVGTSDVITVQNAISINTWYHIAVCRSGTNTKLFKNGTQIGSTYTDTNNYLGASNRPIIGANGNSLNQSYLNGYLDDFRITKGYARYTANFTPPTAALPVK